MSYNILGKIVEETILFCIFLGFLLACILLICLIKS